jgi:hypothetical protein
MKSLLYLSSIFVISVASIFTQSDLSVNFNMPEKVKAGGSFILDIEVNKGDIANFSKLQLNLPEGFTAELIDGKTGTFTFYDQKLKLIWIALPEAPKFNVQVKINVAPSKTGKFNFSGKISYVVGSNRNEKQLLTPNFSIETNTSIAQNSKTQGDKRSKTTSKELNTNNKDQQELNCSRNFDASSIAPGETFLVELSIQKNGITGLGKIIDNLPKGFIATEIESNGAIFSTKGNQVKFLWMTLPSEENFIVSYKVKIDNSVTGNKVIDGKMSYLDGNETKTVLITGTIIKITNSIVKTDQSDTTGKTKANSISTNSDVDVITNINNDVVEQSNKITDVTDNNSVNYRVQICASKKQVNLNYFVKNHQIIEHIYASPHKGWHKYTVGEFEIYKSARNHREIISIQHKIKGPFVTAYNNGVRITVQEALMISKDKWVE